MTTWWHRRGSTILTTYPSGQLAFYYDRFIEDAVYISWVQHMVKTAIERRPEIEMWPWVVTYDSTKDRFIHMNTVVPRVDCSRIDGPSGGPTKKAHGQI